MTLALRYAARSHTGLLREGNEDSVYAGPRLLAVADGMGGHAAGEVASAVAIAALAPLDEDAPGADLLDALRTRAEWANAHLRDMVGGDGALEGMGTTLTALLSAGNRLGLLHIGDSRCYLLRDGELSQITHDHTLVQALVDEGRISAQEAGTHPQRSLITRALDGRDSLDLDLSVREVRVGDRYLLCTDGLTGPVASHDTLLGALSLQPPQEAVDQLVQLALRGGGPDNVTVVVADVVDAEQEHPVEPVVAGAAAEAPQPLARGMGDSPAGRAYAAERPADSGASAVPPAPSPAPRTARRRALVLLVAAAALVVGAAGAWAYVRSQYYVSVRDRQVAVYRGLTGSVAGVALSTLAETTDLSTDRLSDLDAARLERGIQADGRSGADEIVQRLQRQAALECVAGAPTPATTLPTTPATTPAPAVTTPATTPAPAATPTATPVPTSTPTAPGCLAPGTAG